MFQNLPDILIFLSIIPCPHSHTTVCSNVRMLQLFMEEQYKKSVQLFSRRCWKPLRATKHIEERSFEPSAIHVLNWILIVCN